MEPESKRSKTRSQAVGPSYDYNALCASASTLRGRATADGFGIFQLLPAADVKSFGNKSGLVTGSGEAVFQAVVDALNAETNEEDPVAKDMGRQRMQATSQKLLEMRIEGNEDAKFLHR
jgi:hypothetical protein